MKRRRAFICLGLLGVSIGLVGCTEETQIVYDGKSMSKSEVEERLADLLEVDNPDLDLEISIYEESDE